MFSESPRFRQNQNHLHKSPLCYDVLTRKDCDFSYFYAVTRTVCIIIHGGLIIWLYTCKPFCIYADTVALSLFQSLESGAMRRKKKKPENQLFN